MNATATPASSASLVALDKRYFSTGDIARGAGCSCLTVRRYLSLLSIRAPKGEQHRFNASQYTAHVARLNGLRARYPHHILRGLRQELTP